MSTLETRRLRELCSKQETLTQATVLLSLARLKTASGSGYELGSLSGGLVPICAYIASKRLNNNDVAQRSAQVASCLRPQDFDKALNIVESAISAPKPAARTRKSTGVTYQSLFRTRNISESPTMVRMMHEAEEIVFQEAADAPKREVMCIVWFWTCKVIKVPHFLSPEQFQEEYEIPVNDHNFIVKILQKKCSEQKEALKAEWEAMKEAASRRPPPSPVKLTSSPVKSPTKSPTKRVLRDLPTRDPQKRHAELYPPTQPTETPSPTKRRKLEPVVVVQGPDQAGPSHQDPPISTPVTSPRRLTQPAPLPEVSIDVPVTPHRSRIAVTQSTSKSTRRTQDKGKTKPDGDEPAFDNPDDDAPPEVLVSRRFRPVFLDHKQWYRPDPRLHKIWRTAEALKDQMLEQFPHPFEQYKA